VEDEIAEMKDGDFLKLITPRIEDLGGTISYNHTNPPPLQTRKSPIKEPIQLTRKDD